MRGMEPQIKEDGYAKDRSDTDPERGDLLPAGGQEKRGLVEVIQNATVVDILLAVAAAVLLAALMLGAAEAVQLFMGWQGW